MEKVSQIYQDGRHLQRGQILHHLYGSGFVTADLSDIACLGNFLWDDGVWSGKCPLFCWQVPTCFSGVMWELPKEASHFPWLALEVTS